MSVRKDQYDICFMCGRHTGRSRYRAMCGRCTDTPNLRKPTFGLALKALACPKCGERDILYLRRDAKHIVCRCGKRYAMPKAIAGSRKATQRNLEEQP